MELARWASLRKRAEIDLRNEDGGSRSDEVERQLTKGEAVWSSSRGFPVQRRGGIVERQGVMKIDGIEATRPKDLLARRILPRLARELLFPRHSVDPQGPEIRTYDLLDRLLVEVEIASRGH